MLIDEEECCRVLHMEEYLSRLAPGCRSAVIQKNILTTTMIARPLSVLGKQHRIDFHIAFVLLSSKLVYCLWTTVMHF